MDVDQFALASFSDEPQGGVGGVSGAAQAAVQGALGTDADAACLTIRPALSSVVLKLAFSCIDRNMFGRAGSNSPPRSRIPRQSFGLGQNSDSADSFPGRFENSSPGSGEARKIQFSGIGLFAHCVAMRCYFGAACWPRWMTLRSVVHIGPYMSRDGSRATSIGGISPTAAHISGRACARATIELP